MSLGSTLTVNERSVNEEVRGDIIVHYVTLEIRANNEVSDRALFELMQEALKNLQSKAQQGEHTEILEETLGRLEFVRRSRTGCPKLVACCGSFEYEINAVVTPDAK